MILNKTKKGFTLTELLIVLVVVAVLFAAMAPIFTKRTKHIQLAQEDIWQTVNGSEENAFYMYSSSRTGMTPAYVGVKPTGTIAAPKSKFVIYASDALHQNQIQFRYGNEDYGTLSGVLYVDNNGNIKHSTNGYADFLDDNNTALGARTLAETKGSGSVSVAGMTAIGARALEYVRSGTGNNVVAVGANAAQNGYVGLGTVAVGSGAAANLTANTTNTVAIGENTLNAGSAGTSNNVFIGKKVANLGTKNNNVVITSGTSGAGYTPTAAENNTIIGGDAFQNGDNKAVNITAIGNKACSAFHSKVGYDSATDTRGGSRVCIGSGTASKYSADGTDISSLEKWIHTDQDEHLFFGGTPNEHALTNSNNVGLGLLEVHNTSSSGKPVVVFNSNLVVMGNYYFTEGGNLYSAFPPVPLPPNNNLKSDGNSKSIYGNLVTKFNQIFSSKNPSIGPFDYGIADKSEMESPIYRGVQCLGNDVPSTANSYCPSFIMKSSDIRLKDNISENKDALEKLLYVVPYNFSYKSDKDALLHAGVIAQDLQKYLPNSVSEDEKGFLQIRWDEMFYAMINSIKQLDIKLAKSEKDVGGISSDIKDISKSQQDIKKRVKELNKRIAKLQNN